jgi:DNA-binding LacI/PurR family transcriptional regulator
MGEGRTMPPMTIEDIATLAGVSRSTVSRVLNDHPRVSPDVRERVRQVIAEHGYTPHAAARSLAGSRTNVICLFSLRGAESIFSDQFIPPLVQGISEVCNDRGYFLLLSMVQIEKATTLYQRIVRGSHCDGIITLASDVDDALLELIVEDQTPFVLIGRHPRFPQVTSVDAENVAGARQATAHLVGLGHLHIATITGPLDTSTGVDRRDGYLEALREAGLPVAHELIVEGTFRQESGHAAMGQLLALPERPTAVFAASDSMAAGALAAIREAGLRVPEDIAVVGFDDSPIAALTSPTLTTVRQPIYRLGAEAARLLIDQLQDGRPEPLGEQLPVEMVIRDSCGARVRA